VSARAHRHETITMRLAAAGCIAADAEAHEMLAAAADWSVLEAWVRRRERGEPLAWIVGTTAFCGHRVVVEPGVYVPRWQSEELARRAGEHLAGGGGLALDLCTGSGAIAVHLAAVAPRALVLAADLDATAVRCARRNGVHAVVADIGEPFRSASFHVVTAVAPYVPTAGLALLPSDVRAFEPTSALDGGGDGLAIVRRVAAAAARLLVPGGWLLTEVGGDQEAPLRHELAALGFASADAWYDDEGDVRGVVAQR
jgi:release factor glutamine methyltransferase